jgi:protein O-GlcNAc transferase
VAARLAQDRAGRARLRHGLRPAMAGSALCDHRSFAAGLEAAYRDLWARACGGWRGGGPAR